MLNQCSFIGNLGADPEVRSFANGGRICNLRLAVTEKWKSKEGERKEKTEWVSVVINSDGLVGVAERYLRKGSKVFVQGKLSTRKWSDQSGQDRYSTEVVVGPNGVLTMLDGSGGNQSEGKRREPDGSQGHAGGFGAKSGGSEWDQGSDFGDDPDIPFATNRSIW